MSERPECPCGCGCHESMAGIELTWGLCILCRGGEHWQPGDDEPFFDEAALDAMLAVANA